LTHQSAGTMIGYKFALIGKLEFHAEWLRDEP